jgi:hypothetical protein
MSLRRLRILSTLRGPGGDTPPGAELVVDAWEARRLLGAIGLAEDLGEAAPGLDPKPAPAAAPHRAGRRHAVAVPAA